MPSISVNVPLVFLASLLFFCACENEAPRGTSACIDASVEDFKLMSCDDGAMVTWYLFQDIDVYTFDPGYCIADGTTTVLNATCDSIGFLGGIAGNNIIQGESFDNAIFQATIWMN